jgi:hypothetical protein
MHSTFDNERFPTSDHEHEQNAPTGFEARLGDQLDEIAVFALVAVAVFYIAAASCWFVF